MNTPPPASRTYTNVILTVIAGLLAVVVLARPDGALPAARAQEYQPVAMEPPSEDAAGRISAAEQRKVMIAELRNISARLERLESALSRVVNVKVVDMPPIRVQEKAQQP
ncbi:hypothetical protein PHYC_01430 [Phycisphaerales bacterium]|nr:hypothetical protein PHYC_01430 [Phycisphaerales bacterium]